MNATKNRLGLMIAMATCIVALAVPAAGRTASIARCDVRALTPFTVGGEPRIFYRARVKCNGSVTLDDVVVKLQKQRFAGGWDVIAKAHSGPVEVRRRQLFGPWKECRRRLVGTFRTMAIMTKGSNSEKDVSAEARITCPLSS